MVLQSLKERGCCYPPRCLSIYPHCWRCDTPLIYYARESWFIQMTAVKEDLIRNNNTINWIPESIGKGRFGRLAGECPGLGASAVTVTGGTRSIYWE